MSIVVDYSDTTGIVDLEQSSTDSPNKKYQLLGRGVTLGAATVGEIVELVGVALTNAGVFAECDDVTLGGLITLGAGIGLIFVIESIVMKRGKDAGITLDLDLIRRVSARAVGGIFLVASYFTLIYGYARGDSMSGGAAMLDVGVGIGLAGLYLLRGYL